MVFIVEIGIGVAGYVKHSDLENMMEKGFNHTMENYSTNKEYQASWSFLQSEVGFDFIFINNLKFKIFVF